MSYINFIDVLLPEDRIYFKDYKSFIDNAQENEIPFKSFEDFDSFVIGKLNLDSVIVEKEKSFQDLIFQKLDENVDSGNILPQEIDYILIAVDWDDQLKDIGHKIQYEYGMDKASVIRLTGNYCCNIDMAIILADKLLKGEVDKKNVLIITGSVLGNSMSKRIVGTYGVMGDSVGVMIMSNHSDGNTKYELLKSSTITKGVLHKIDLVKDNAILHYQSYTLCLRDLLKDQNKDDIKKIILHNSNQFLIEQVVLGEGFSIDMIDKENINKYGHLGTTDLLLNLNTYYEKSKSPELVFSLNLGVVGTYISLLFNKI
jgi:3-oxoacyl-[acyl-carrier-protein] synthase III